MNTIDNALAPLVERIDEAVREARYTPEPTPEAPVVDLVTDALRIQLPGPDLLTPEQLAGSPDGYATHLLYGSDAFSIVAAVFRPGQRTPIHDHVTWCVVGVLQGVEHETIYRLRDDVPEPCRVNDNPNGTVTGFAPPGDIHRVVNAVDRVTVSLHVYGADIRVLGSSVRRVYEPEPALA